MSKGNKTDADLLASLEAAHDALDAALSALRGGAPKARPQKVRKLTPKSNRTLDFSMPLRAFVKKHSGSMNGAKKFTLLLAYLSKGNDSVSVNLSDVESHWNRMTAKGLLGMKFNRLYSSEARDNDWAATEKSGVYKLRPSWKAILNG